MNQLPFNHYSPDRMILWTLLISALLHGLAGFGLVSSPVLLRQDIPPAVISVELREIPGALRLPLAVKPQEPEKRRPAQPMIRVRDTRAPLTPMVRHNTIHGQTAPTSKPVPLSPASTVTQDTTSDMVSPALPGTISGQQREYGKNTASAVTMAAGSDATTPRGTASAALRGAGSSPLSSQPSTAYYARIREGLERNKEYPHLARRARMEGSVTVQFQILGNGSPDALRVTKSSGYGVLDESALRTVRNSAPFPLPAVQQGAKDLLISVPLVFRLER
jgi:protein TonB